jgi:hypothetical protein
MASNRAVGFLFGILGAILIVLEGLLDFIRSALFLAIGHPLIAWDEFTASILFVVLGIVFAVLAMLGRSRGNDRALASGVVMVVLALLGLVVLGFANGLVGLLGTIFVLIGGIFYIVEAR